MADNSSIDMIRATQADIPALSGVLAQAFHDDPVFQWLVPDPEPRRSTLPSVFAAFARVYVPHGESYLAGNATGAALWAPPGVDPFDGRALEVFAREMTETLGDRVERALELDQILREHHPEEPYAFLQLIGVSPAGQGRGLGSRMLHAVLRRCDLRGTPAYLEATSVANRRLYHRYGFETVSEITIPGGPTLWAMWRTPPSSARTATPLVTSGHAV